MKKQEIIDKYGLEYYQEHLRKVKEYRQEHKEEIAECQKRYNQEHKEEIVEYQKRYHQEHREELLEGKKQYYREHREERLEYDKRHRQEHPEYLKQYRQTQYGRAATLLGGYHQKDKLKGFETDLTPEWIVNNIFNSKCYYCEESDWTQLGTDRIDNTKGHTMDNCICACMKCNAGRGNRYSVEEFKRYKQIRQKIA